MRLRWIVFLSIVLALASFSALYYVATHLWPDPESHFARPQLFFLLFTFLSLGSGTIPVTAYLNYRFARPDWVKQDKIRLLRQGAWVGLWGVILCYLQLIRALNWTIALISAGVLILIEVFFLIRD
jgi:hypothetical protein